jgi:hypothetical protein
MARSSLELMKSLDPRSCITANSAAANSVRRHKQTERKTKAPAGKKRHFYSLRVRWMEKQLACDAGFEAENRGRVKSVANPFRPRTLFTFQKDTALLFVPCARRRRRAL